MHQTTLAALCAGALGGLLTLGRSGGRRPAAMASEANTHRDSLAAKVIREANIRID